MFFFSTSPYVRRKASSAIGVSKHSLFCNARGFYFHNDSKADSAAEI